MGLDEVQVFGKPSENVNLALKSNGTRVHTDTDFNQQGGRFPIERVIDGKFGTQRWQASFNKEKKQNPWLELTFAKPIMVGRLRLSTNREYYLETDYLEQKNKFNFNEFLVNVKKPDGTWQQVASINEFQKLAKREKQLSDSVQEINHLTYRLSEEGPGQVLSGVSLSPN